MDLNQTDGLEALLNQINEKLPSHVRPWWVTPSTIVFVLSVIFGGGQVYNMVTDVLDTVHDHIAYDMKQSDENIKALQALTAQMSLTKTEIALLKAVAERSYSQSEAAAHQREDELRDTHMNQQLEQLKQQRNSR